MSKPRKVHLVVTSSPFMLSGFYVIAGAYKRKRKALEEAGKHAQLRVITLEVQK
jgi:hypothetical protein